MISVFRIDAPRPFASQFIFEGFGLPYACVWMFRNVIQQSLNLFQNCFVSALAEKAIFLLRLF